MMKKKDSFSSRDRALSRFPHTPNENKIFNVFAYVLFGGCFLAMLAIILYLVYSFVSATFAGSHANDWLLGIFSDFVEIMNASLSDSPYLHNGQSYPPIAILILLPFSLICKDVFALYSHETGLTINELTARVVLHGEFWIALILFFTVSTASILLLLFLKYRPAPSIMLKMGAMVACSAPFVYAIMRGNTIYFALIFLLVFLLLYEHPNPIAREIAYFCLALSGAIKIYPLFFGVFLLRKKRFFPAVRVAIYSVLIFLISFGLFEDGISSFLENLGGFMQDGERLLNFRNLSFASLLYKLCYWIVPASVETTAFSAVNLIFMILIFVISTPAAILTKSDFSRSLIAVSVIILIPSITYFYVLAFMIVPLLEFIFHYEEMPAKRRKFYTPLFLILFFTPFIMPQFYIPHALMILTMWGAEIIWVIRDEAIPFIQKQKRKENSL